jgi:hypothetical protein
MLRRTTDGAVIDVDDAALDENGILRDGHRMRVPMQFRDSARRTTPTLRFADGRTDVPVGSRPGFVVDAGGGQEIRDRAYRESVEALRNAWRGGAVDGAPSLPDAPVPARDAVGTDLPTLIARLNDARRSAYETFCRELQDAWRRPT